MRVLVVLVTRRQYQRHLKSLVSTIPVLWLGSKI